jgi:hypothetical protein
VTWVVYAGFKRNGVLVPVVMVTPKPKPIYLAPVDPK